MNRVVFSQRMLSAGSATLRCAVILVAVVCGTVHAGNESEPLTQGRIDEAKKTLAEVDRSDRKAMKELAKDFLKDMDQGFTKRKYKFAVQMGSLAEEAAISSGDTPLCNLIGKKFVQLAGKATDRFDDEVDPRRHWFPVFKVGNGDVLAIRAQGRWNLWPDGPKEDWDTTADGTRFRGDKLCSAPNLPMGALVGRISGSTMLLGVKKIVVVSADGTLEIAANDVTDDRRNDNNGRMRVTILRFAD